MSSGVQIEKSQKQKLDNTTKSSKKFYRGSVQVLTTIKAHNREIQTESAEA